MKHTNGPWKFTLNVGPTKALIVETDGSTVVELSNRTRDSRFEANARLIAAAPDLLAACVEFLPILDRQLASINPGGAAEGSTAFKTASERVERMRAAISRATGEDRT